MVYKDKLTINKNFKNSLRNHEDFHSDRMIKRKSIKTFFKSNSIYINKIWWSLLTCNEQDEVYKRFILNLSERENFFIDMMKQYDKTCEIREIKLKKLI